MCIVVLFFNLSYSQTYTADEYKHNENNWSLKEDGENLLIYEPEESKVWAQFVDDSRFELIGTDDLKFHYNGEMYWESKNELTPRIKLGHSGIHAYFDYKDNLYFRADRSWISALVLQGDGNVAIGFTTTYSDGYRYTNNKLHVNGNAAIGYGEDVDAPSNGLIVYGNSYFNSKVGIHEMPQSDCALYITKIGGEDYSMKAYGSTYLTSGTYLGSDKAFKKNIETIPNALELVNNLRGVRFEYKTDEFEKYKFEKGNHYGLIAQEIIDILPEVVKKADSLYLAINYTEIIPILVEAIKEQNITISNQEIELIELKSKIVDIQNQFSDLILNGNNSNLKSSLVTAIPNLEDNSAKLYQNQPNPSNQATEISYYLPETIQQSYILIMDLNGKQIKRFELVPKSGINKISIANGELPSGMYIYTMVADGAEVGTKRMILTEY